MDETYKIAVLDDNPFNLKLVAEVLDDKQYDLILCLSSKQLFEFLEQETPDLILLDIMLPDVNGFEVCRRIKARPGTAHVPVLFLSAKVDTIDIVKGLNLGAVDYISKPFRPVELIARVRTHLENKKMRDQLHKAYEEQKKANQIISEQNRELLLLNQILEDQSVRDPLTKLYNRRYAIEQIRSLIAHYKRTKTPFSILLGDVDKFKRINDTFGHNIGDEVLVSFALLFQKGVREQDTVARWGGEEFLLILPETNVDGAIMTANKLLHEIRGFEFDQGDHSFAVTFTIGVSSYREGWSLEELVKTADDALYYGKRHGRNRAVHERDVP